MALPTLNVDDRTYDQLLEVLRRHLPVGDWTDHNPSDPGIALLELLAWLGEMSLYRLNRVPQAHREKFLDLLIDPPQPATVEIELDAVVEVPGPGEPQALPIPAGTRFATDFTDGKRLVYETVGEVVFERPTAGGPELESATVTARELLGVDDQRLGTSDGTPGQVFALSPPRRALGVPAGRPLPVLVDFVHRSPGYLPNPRVRVGADDWEIRPTLLDEASRVDPASPGEPRHYTIDWLGDRIRFGDGVFGAVPPAGAEIRCSYRVLEGPAALVRSGELVHLLDRPALLAGETLVFRHGDAEGGLHFFTAEERTAAGLGGFRRRHRLVTAADFEEVVGRDFNEHDARLAAAPRVLDAGELAERVAAAPAVRRTMAVMNRRPPLADGLERRGHVTLLVLGDVDTDLLGDENVPLAAKQAAVELEPGLAARLRRFLDGRRLLTTRLHLVPPVLREISLTARVLVHPERNPAVVDPALRQVLRGFLDVLAGGFDGRGWPLGRAVYRSELYRLLEEEDGVDHVESLQLSPAPQGDVILGRGELPVLQNLFLTVART